jgi:hypothetical protein
MEVVREKSNEELGEVVRADLLAENKIKLRWNKLKQLGQKVETGNNKVPK